MEGMERSNKMSEGDNGIVPFNKLDHNFAIINRTE